MAARFECDPALAADSSYQLAKIQNNIDAPGQWFTDASDAAPEGLGSALDDFFSVSSIGTAYLADKVGRMSELFGALANGTSEVDQSLASMLNELRITPTGKPAPAGSEGFWKRAGEAGTELVAEEGSHEALEGDADFGQLLHQGLSEPPPAPRATPSAFAHSVQDVSASPHVAAQHGQQGGFDVGAAANAIFATAYYGAALVQYIKNGGFLRIRSRPPVSGGSGPVPEEGGASPAGEGWNPAAPDLGVDQPGMPGPSDPSQVGTGPWFKIGPNVYASVPPRSSPPPPPVESPPPPPAPEAPEVVPEEFPFFDE